MYQALAFALTFCNYAVLHATRAAWSNATPSIIKKYPEQFDGQLISYMNSAFLVCYASAGIFSGHISDRFSKKKFICLAYLAIGANVILLGSL